MEYCLWRCVRAYLDILASAEDDYHLSMAAVVGLDPEEWIFLTGTGTSPGSATTQGHPVRGTQRSPPSAIAARVFDDLATGARFLILLDHDQPQRNGTETM
jgi:hypothetical protein